MKTNYKIKGCYLLMITVLFFNLENAFGQSGDRVFFTTGFKIGEISDNSVVVWTRLCKTDKVVPIKHERNPAPYRAPIKYNSKMPVSEMDGEVEGSFGEVKVLLKSKDHTVETDWTYVSSLSDYTYKKKIEGLKSNTSYTVEIMGRKFKGREKKDVELPDLPSTSIVGKFKTAPSISDIIPITFTTSTCQYFWDYDDSIRGFKIYDAMRKLKPLFHCHTGDFVYYDKAGPIAVTIEQARYKWHAANAWPALVDFYSEVPLYIQKDDHDTLSNDAYPGMEPFGEITFEDGVKLWYEQVPIEGKPYRTFRWGKDLQIWLVEGREYRSDNNMPDGAQKTILGEEQKKWLVESVGKSDATFKLLISATPVVGPDRSGDKSDNHANEAFTNEATWLRKFLIDNEMQVVIGDRHWQYVSKYKDSGLFEISAGPTSDCHAQGWDQDDKRPEHQFLRVAGGFASVNVYRKNNVPMIEFIHHDVDGNIVNKEIIKKN